MLEGFADSRPQLAAVRELEDEGDRLSREAIADLFRSGADPLTIIRWKDIHEQIEEALDACENVADVLEAILVKNRVTLLVVTVVVALAFDFTNGFHDTANAVATSVSTRALSPRLAVLIAAVANLARRVRDDRGREDGRRRDHRHGPRHREDRARGGARRDRLEPAHVVVRASVVLVACADRRARSARRSPSRGRAASSGTVSRTRSSSRRSGRRRSPSPPRSLLLLAIYWVFKRLTPGLANRSFRLGQLATGTWVAFTHGANDAQKTMGVIALALYSEGQISYFYIPTWVKIAAGLAIAAGTYSGGWRIMRTLGQRVYQLEPPSGFAAQATAGAVIWALDEARLPALDDACRLGRA